jgi:hypothetical protein
VDAVITAGAVSGNDTRNGTRAHCRLIVWLIPDLALTVALTTLLLVFSVFGGERSLFSDSDTGWHIRNGEQILTRASLPHTDPFSFSRPGEPWIAWEWGADVLMAAVYRASGLGGIALLYGLCIGASVWIWSRINLAAGGNFLLAGLFFLILSPSLTLHWLARPHIISWVFLTGTVWLCERMPLPLRWRHLAFVAALAAAWANLHGSFFFAPLIASIYALGNFLKPVIWKVSASPAPGDARGQTCVLLALAAAAGTLVNPSGWRLHQHVLSYLLNSGLQDQIAEFRSFDFHEAGAFPVMLTLAVCFAGGIAALVARKPERFLLSMLLTALALRSTRAIPVAALLLLPLANGSITTALSRAHNLAPAFRRWLNSARAYGDGLEAVQRGFRGFTIVPLMAILIFASIRSRAGFGADTFPVAASGIVASLPANARIFAPDFFGGYLIFRFNGERKVFFDGRSDFYGEEFVKRYLCLVQVQPGWRNEFNRWSFTHALLPPDYPLIPALEASGWRELYRDGTAVLLTGRSRL